MTALRENGELKHLLADADKMCRGVCDIPEGLTCSHLHILQPGRMFLAGQTGVSGNRTDTPVCFQFISSSLFSEKPLFIHTLFKNICYNRPTIIKNSPILFIQGKERRKVVNI